MSSIEERKRELHSIIDSINDEEELEVIIDTLKVYPPRKKDIIDYLSAEELEELAESIKEDDNGLVVPHEEVMKMSKEWRIR